MPYLIYTPYYTSPYVLDNEDEHFLHYFERWGWPYEQRPITDTVVLQTINREHKLRRTTLYNLWEKECRLRVRAEEKRQEASSKEIERAKKQAVKEAEGKQGLRDRVARLFARKGDKSLKYGKGDVEVNGYRNGKYVNRLEDLQKKWAEEDNS